MGLYRAILWMLTPALALHLLVSRLRGRVGAGAFAERFGLAAGSGAELWLHGASNGELTSARWLIERIIAARPDLRLVITCNSWTARQMVMDWHLPRTSVRLAPFDTAGAVRRFRKAWHPRALVFLENELWLERIVQMADAGPVICIGARMSERSARRWARVAPRLMALIMARLRLVSAQDAGSAKRFVTLGLPAERLGPQLMLKAYGLDVAGPGLSAPVGAARDRVLLAASTHEGEEAIVLNGFAEAHRDGAFDLLILAPRHPRRIAEVRALVQATGLPFAIRSANQPLTAGIAVYVADTLGEMAQWYAMAGATLVCGSFGDAGGHTPYEPAAHRSAILHGPNVANFADAYAALDAAGGALAVTAETLGAALKTLDTDRQLALASAARAALTPADESALVTAVLQALPGQDNG